MATEISQDLIRVTIYPYREVTDINILIACIGKVEMKQIDSQ